MPDWILPLIVAIPFAAAAIALFVGKWAGTRTGLLMVAAAATCFSLVLWLIVDGGAFAGGHEVAQHAEHATDVEAAAAPSHGIVEFVRPWIPDFKIGLRFRADSFGLFFAMLISGIGTLVGVYSSNYIEKSLAPNRIGRYYAALIAFMGAMLGIALSDDLILLFVFWEITSITSFMLIGFWYEQEIARKGAWTALQVTGLGGLAMMVGFIMVGIAAKTFSISEIIGSAAIRESIASSPLFGAALLCIFGGAFTKSAQWPFHFWLPNAMVAPTPVSTYLHAATMVKAGIFLVGRMWHIFDGSPYWSPLLITCGLITFSYTAYQSFKEHDLKAILARTTLSTLGLVMLIYGLKQHTQDALQIFNHAAYKGALFLVVGIVEHTAHTRDIRKLGGMRKQLPMTFWCCVLAALSMAGLPPFFGFLAKESLYGALIGNKLLTENPALQLVVIGLAVVSNAFIFAVSFKLIFGVFLGERAKPQAAAGGEHDHGHGHAHGHDGHHEHHEKLGLWLPPAVLAGTTLVVGLLGATHLIQNMVNAFSSDTQALALAHAHGESGFAHVSLIPTHVMPVVLSLLTIGLGVLIYRKREAVNRAQAALEKLPTMQAIWDGWMHGVSAFATTFSRKWQSGSIQWYFGAILVFFVALPLSVMWGRYDLSLEDALESVSYAGLPWYVYPLVLLLVWAAITVARARTRITAAIATTAVGFLVSLVFVVYRSPDIVLTQILIETVSTIFILLILFFMPSWKPQRSTNVRKMIHLGISAGVGFTAFALTLMAITTFKEPNNIGLDYLRRSLAQADGSNAVNVIIVDFRALDTSGEVIVLVVVGLCIYGVLRSRRKPLGALNG